MDIREDNLGLYTMDLDGSDREFIHELHVNYPVRPDWQAD
jgi:hypothetical protein